MDFASETHQKHRLYPLKGVLTCQPLAVNITHCTFKYLMQQIKCKFYMHASPHTNEAGVSCLQQKTDVQSSMITCFRGTVTPSSCGRFTSLRLVSVQGINGRTQSRTFTSHEVFSFCQVILYRIIYKYNTNKIAAKLLLLQQNWDEMWSTRCS